MPNRRDRRRRKGDGDDRPPYASEPVVLHGVSIEEVLAWTRKRLKTQPPYLPPAGMSWVVIEERGINEKGLASFRLKVCLVPTAEAERLAEREN